MGRNVTVWSCARRRLDAQGAARLAVAGVAAVMLCVCVEPAVRAAADAPAYAFAGTVVDPNGKPVAGAKVWFDYALARPPAQSATADAVSDAEGKFQFSRAKSSLADVLESPYPTIGVLVATKESFGFAAGPADRFETTGRLAVDRPKLVRRAFGRMKREGGKKPRVEARRSTTCRCTERSSTATVGRWPARRSKSSPFGSARTELSTRGKRA